MIQNTSGLVRELMTEFVELTGLSGQQSPQRYLWTYALADCNFLELYRQTGTDRYRELAVCLVDQVHQVLGRHRADDARTGWISGLDERAGQQHPTQGGLRIGKKLSERKRAEPYDERLKWDRDGQYYHYLLREPANIKPFPQERGKVAALSLMASGKLNQSPYARAAVQSFATF